MNLQLSEWLKGQNLQEGIALFRAHSPYNKAKTELIIEFASDGSLTGTNKLVFEIKKLLASAKDAQKKETAKKKPQQKKRSITIPHNEPQFRKRLPDANELPQALQVRRYRITSIYAQINQHRGAILATLKHQSDQWRYNHAKAIVQLHTELREHFVHIDHFIAHGEMIEEDKPIVIASKRLVQMLRAYKNNGSYITKFKGRADKSALVAQKRAELDQIEAFISEIQ
jgi:hypothetical protein